MYWEKTWVAFTFHPHHKGLYFQLFPYSIYRSDSIFLTIFLEEILEWHLGSIHLETAWLPPVPAKYWVLSLNSSRRQLSAPISKYKTDQIGGTLLGTGWHFTWYSLVIRDISLNKETGGHHHHPALLNHLAALTCTVPTRLRWPFVLPSQSFLSWVMIHDFFWF